MPGRDGGSFASVFPFGSCFALATLLGICQVQEISQLPVCGDDGVIQNLLLGLWLLSHF